MRPLFSRSVLWFDQRGFHPYEFHWDFTHVTRTHLSHLTIHMQHAGNASASGLSQNRPYTPLLSGLRSIRQLDWIHLKIVLFVSLYTPTATTGIIVVLQFAFCVRRRNMTHSSLSPNTTKTGCTRSNLNPHFIQFNAKENIEGVAAWSRESR